MPAYEYESDQGGTITLVRPVDQRDAMVLIRGTRYRRRTVPSRITVGSGAKPETIGAKLTKGYHQLENLGKLSDKNPNYLPVNKIKEALAMPEVD